MECVKYFAKKVCTRLLTILVASVPVAVRLAKEGQQSVKVVTLVISLMPKPALATKSKNVQTEHLQTRKLKLASLVITPALNALRVEIKVVLSAMALHHCSIKKSVSTIVPTR